MKDNAALKDSSNPLKPLGQLLDTSARLLASEQRTVITVWKLVFTVVVGMWSVRSMIRSISLPKQINNTLDYVRAMHKMDQLEIILSLFSYAFAENLYPKWVLRIIEKTHTMTKSKYSAAQELIKSFDWPEDRPCFFQREGQRAIWKSRNGKYIPLKLQPNDPQMEDLRKSLAALPD